MKLLCLLLAALLLTGCAAAPEEPTETHVPIVQLANPWADYETLREAEAAAGLSLGIPERIAGFQAEQFRVLNGNLLEITYRNGDYRVVVRKTSGSGEDISGVYGAWDKQTFLTWDSRDITTQYYGDAIVDSVWSPEETVALYAAMGYPEGARYAFLGAVLGEEGWQIRVNEAFNAQITENGTTRASELSCFFTCNYDAPEQINLAEFLRYCPLGQRVEENSDEGRAIKALDGTAFAVTPVWRYPATAVSQLLDTYAGISVEDLESQEGVLYLPEYDAYYDFVSDWGPGKFCCTGGEKTGDTITLWSDTHVLTLRDENGEYRIVSYMENSQ